MKLYEHVDPMTRALRAHWVLCEAGAEYTTETVDLFARPDWFLAISPLGKVPALVDGETVMFESLAICMHVADRFPKANLAPVVDSPTRPLYYQWLAYVSNNLDPLLWQISLHTRILPEARRVPGAVPLLRREFLRNAGPLEDRVDGREAILDSGFSAADIMLGQVYAWAGMLGLLEDLPAASTYLARLGERPAFPAAMQAA